MVTDGLPAGLEQVVKQVGHGLVRVVLASGETETYLITLPKLVIEGIFFGAPYVELRCGTLSVFGAERARADGTVWHSSEHSYIQGSHGLTTTIEYKGKGTDPLSHASGSNGVLTHSRSRLLQWQGAHLHRRHRHRTVAQDAALPD